MLKAGKGEENGRGVAKGGISPCKGALTVAGWPLRVGCSAGLVGVVNHYVRRSLARTLLQHASGEDA